MNTDITHPPGVLSSTMVNQDSSPTMVEKIVDKFGIAVDRAKSAWPFRGEGSKSTRPLHEEDPLEIPENDDENDDKGDQGHLDEEDRGVGGHLDEEQFPDLNTSNKVGRASKNRSRYDLFNNRSNEELDENEITNAELENHINESQADNTFNDKLNRQVDILDQMSKVLTPVVTTKPKSSLEVPNSKRTQSRSGSRTSRVSTLSKASRTSSQKRKEVEESDVAPKPKRKTNLRKLKKEYEVVKKTGKCTCVEFPSFVCPVEDEHDHETPNNSKCDDDDLNFTPVGKNGKPLQSGSSSKKKKSKSKLNHSRDFFLKSPPKN